MQKVFQIQFNCIESTSLWAKQNAAFLDPEHLTCITAHEQTAGRGRLGREWNSPRGNLYTTIFFCLPYGSKILPNVPQVIALSCVEVLAGMGIDLQIKWPNDILHDGKKCAGIIAEAVPLENRMGVAVGIGFNVNMALEDLDTIDQPATSLSQITGQPWPVRELLQRFLEQFQNDLQLLQSHGFAAFHAKLDAKLAFRGQEISCQTGYETITGICHSVAEDGRLNLLCEGGLKSLISGEVHTFRPLSTACSA